MTKIASEYVEIAVADGTRMLAWVSRPSGDAYSRGLIVFQEVFGMNSHIRNLRSDSPDQGLPPSRGSYFIERHRRNLKELTTIPRRSYRTCRASRKNL